MKKLLLIPIVSLVFLTACNPDEVEENDNPHVLDLAEFSAWPQGEVEQADPGSIGQDNLVFIVDRSGSMSDGACDSEGSKSEVVIEALSQFIPQIPTATSVAYLDFGDNTKVVEPLGINNRSELVEAAVNHEPDMGGTDLGEAVRVGYDMLIDQAHVQGSTGTYRLVLIVDGGANDRNRLRRVLKEMSDTPVEVITAGFCIGSNHVLNQPEDNVYLEASNVEDLVNVLQRAVEREAATFVADFSN